MKKILKLTLAVIIFVGFCLGVYFLLGHFGINDISTLRNWVEKSGNFGPLVFILFQMCFSTFVCIVPFEDELMVISGIVLFGAWKAFIVCSICMFLTSSLQFLIGDKLGEKVVAKLVGKDTLIMVQNKFDLKSKIMLPFMYCIPLFPHDAVCLVAGMTKMRYWYFAIITFIMRTLEIALICLGKELINWKTIEIYEYLIIINLIIIDIFLLTKLEKLIENKIKK